MKLMPGIVIKICYAGRVALLPRQSADLPGDLCNSGAQTTEFFEQHMESKSSALELEGDVLQPVDVRARPVLLDDVLGRRREVEVAELGFDLVLAPRLFADEG
jgi:hypothetical protein